MKEHPEQLIPFTESDIARMRAVTKDVTVSDGEVIPVEVTL
jgi:antitoxin PrlF